MDNQANVVGARPGDAERPRESDVAALGRGGRMSRQRKTAAVLRLLRGEDLETVSRAVQRHRPTAIPVSNNAANSSVKARPASLPVNARVSPAKPDDSGTPPGGVSEPRR